MQNFAYFLPAFCRLADYPLRCAAHRSHLAEQVVRDQIICPAVEEGTLCPHFEWVGSVKAPPLLHSTRLLGLTARYPELRLPQS